MPSYKTNNMMKSTNEQLKDAIEQAIIGLSSGLQDIERDTPEYYDLKDKVEELFEKWRELDKLVNPCDININE